MVEKQFRSIPYYGVLLAFIALSAVFQNARADETVLDAKEAFLDLDVEDLAVGMHLSFAEWCSTSFCNLRLFAVVGGELLMVDSGSSSLAYCDPPNTEFVTDQSRLYAYDATGTGHFISQCTKYGSGGHGWFGDTYTGTIETAGIKNKGQVYTVMNTTVGLVGNQCGPILEGSIGIQENTTVRGIMGTGNNDQYTVTEWINASTWTDLAQKSGRCIWGECECPAPFIAGLPSTFMSALAANEIYQFSITWNGILGKDTGAMLWNEFAEINIPKFNPRVPIEKDPQRSLRLWSTNVTGMALDWEMTNVSRTMYYLDTGAGYISLPNEIYDSVQDGTVVTFFFPTMDWEYGNASEFGAEINITVTQELMDARVFRRASELGFHLMGLNVFRYLDTLLISYNDTNPYFRATVKENPILDLPANLPVGELAASASEEIPELNVTNVTAVSDTAVMDIAGIPLPSAAKTSIWKTGITLTNVALAAATIPILLSALF